MSCCIGCGDVGAISDILGDKGFLMGETPTQLDPILYRVLSHIARVPIKSPVKDEIKSRLNLVAFLKRIQEHFFE